MCSAQVTSKFRSAPPRNAREPYKSYMVTFFLGLVQGERIRKCVCLCTMYDLLIMCALRRFFRIINVCCDSFRAIIMMTAGYHGFLIRINGDISQ